MAEAARAADWPQFRGPTRDGEWKETGVLETFPADGPRIRWRQPVGVGWSSPVVASGRVVVTDAELDDPDAKERVLCFDVSSGAPLWTFAYDVTYPEWVFVEGQSTGPAATPAIDGECVYSVGGNGHIHCLDAATGERRWDRDLGREYDVEPLQCRPSPLVDGELVIVFTGARPGASVAALDRTTGAERWKALDEPVSNSSPIIVVAGGRRQLIVWTGQSISALDPATGEVLWREPMVTSSDGAIATPVVEGDHLLISGLMLRLEADRPAASVRWPDSRAASGRILSNTSSPLLRDGHVYAARSSGELVCLDAETGEPVWEDATVTGRKSGAAIHLTPQGDGVFLFTDEGCLIRARVSPAGYRETARARLIEPTSPFGGGKRAWSPPAYADRCVFARSDEEIVCASLGAEP